MENIKKIKKEVKKIGKGYSVNVYDRTGDIFINGDNTLCLTINSENEIKFNTVGGSRIAYTETMTVNEFIEKMPKMLLSNDEIDQMFRKLAVVLMN